MKRRCMAFVKGPGGGGCDKMGGSHGGHADSGSSNTPAPPPRIQPEARAGSGGEPSTLRGGEYPLSDWAMKGIRQPKWKRKKTWTFAESYSLLCLLEERAQAVVGSREPRD
eukprot:753734-Hanusia_phi.AAC.1